MTKLRQHNIIDGVIWKELLYFFFPILLGAFFQQMYNTVDAAIVGNYVGDAALASVGGATGTFINLLVGFFMGLSSGCGVLVSQYFGSKDYDFLKKSIHTAIAISIAVGIVITIIGISCSSLILDAMNTPNDIKKYANDYFVIYFSGVLAVVLYNMCSGILRALGDSTRPLIYLIVCTILNIGLDLLFVVVFKMEVVGVALATVISQAISAILTIISLMKLDKAYRLHIKEIRFHKELLVGIFRLGIPAGLQSTMYAISNIIIQGCVNSFGTNTVAAWTAFGKVDAFYWMTINAFGISVTTFVGQNYGAKKMDRVYKSVRTCSTMACVASATLGILFITFGRQLLMLFTKNPDVINEGYTFYFTNSAFYLTYVFIDMFSGALRGRGKALVPTLICCFGVCIFRLIWIFTIVPYFNEFFYVRISYPISWALTSTLFAIYYFHIKKGEKQQLKLENSLANT